MDDFAQLDMQVNTSISKIESYVKNPAGTAPLDDELNTLLTQLNAATNKISDPTQMAAHTMRIQRLDAKIKQYQVARNSIQSQTRTDLIGVAAGQKEVKDAAEQIKELNINTIEFFLKFSNLIIEKFTAPGSPDRLTMQAIRGSDLLAKITAAGFSYHLTPKGIELQAMDPSRTQKAAETSLALNTLVKTGVLSIDEIKAGLLYATPSFGIYANNSRLADGTLNTGAKMQDYVAFLQKKPVAELTREEKTILESQSALNAVKMPELIRSYQNIGQMGSAVATDSDLVAQAKKIAESGASGVSQKEVPPGMIQGGANTVSEKASELVGKTAENIGDFTTGTLKAIGKAFDKSPIGGMVVAILAIFAGWKFLTGDWGVGKMKAPGWVIALVAAGGAAAVDMAKSMGYDVSDLPGAAEKTGKTIKGAAEKATGGQKPGSDDADAEPQKDTTKKPAAKPIETKELSPSQIEATKSIEANVDIKKSLDGKTPGITDYLNFLHSEVSTMQMDKLINDTDMSIFSPSSQIDSGLQGKLGKLNPITLKKVLRAYIGAPVLFVIPSDGSKPGKKEQEAFLKKLGEKGLNVDEYKKSKTLAELTSVLYAAEKPKEAVKLSPESRKKILAYELIYNNEAKPTDNFTITFADTPDEDGDFKVTLTPKNPKLLKPEADRIDPIEIYFDKDGNLRSEEIEINGCAIILGQEIPGNQVCSLKQDKNKIIITKK